MQKQLQLLKRLLLDLPPEEIVSFRDRLREQMDAAFRWDLWGAAYLIAGGCSDDGFTDFRAWLISMGRRIFEHVLMDVESLAEVADAPGVEEVFFEEFLYVPAEAYEEATGHGLPEYTEPRRESPAGEPWQEDAHALERRFPRLWKKYGRQ